MDVNAWAGQEYLTFWVGMSALGSVLACLTWLQRANTMQQWYLEIKDPSLVFLGPQGPDAHYVNCWKKIAIYNNLLQSSAETLVHKTCFMHSECSAGPNLFIFQHFPSKISCSFFEGLAQLSFALYNTRTVRHHGEEPTQHELKVKLRKKVSF